jgi:hypothetical protein
MFMSTSTDVSWVIDSYRGANVKDFSKQLSLGLILSLVGLVLSALSFGVIVFEDNHSLVLFVGLAAGIILFIAGSALRSAGSEKRLIFSFELASLTDRLGYKECRSGKAHASEVARKVLVDDAIQILVAEAFEDILKNKEDAVTKRKRMISDYLLFAAFGLVPESDTPRASELNQLPVGEYFDSARPRANAEIKFAQERMIRRLKGEPV